MTQISGQLTITDVEQFPSVICFAVNIKAHPNNTATIWIGNDGNDTVASGTGFPLNAGEAVIVILDVGNLSTLYATADVSNEKACWIITDA